MNNIFIERIYKVGFWVGVLLVVFLVAVSIKEFKEIRYVGKNAPIMNAITVSGKGEALSIPDIATFSFGVTENAKTVDEAQAKATTKINSAMKALKDNKIDDKDIKTISYNINPHYEYVQGLCTSGICRPGKSVLSGYDVSQTIEVKIRDIKKAGALFTTIGSLDIQNINNLTFSIDDIESVKAEAREKAIENAKAKAKTLAKDLNVKLVRITSFYEASDDPNYFYREGMSGDMMVKNVSLPSAPQVPAGEQKITSSVSITYEIR
ncbi:MAG TPA: SIMPL domain-containing protein [Candidatus Paceibacterota bacterium]